jgi:DNA-directed RNA polymerase subunit beta'
VLATDPQTQFEDLKAKFLDRLKSTFPIQSRKGDLEVRVSNLSVSDDIGVDDIKGQAQAKLKAQSWAVPVKGDIQIVDKAGKVLVEKKGQQLAKLPKMTRHFTYIVGGDEKSVANQWRLRPGPYVRETERKGEVRAQFQLAKGKSFNIEQDSNSGYLHIKMGGRKVPLVSVLRAYGVSDDAMKKAWGEESFNASASKARGDKDLISLHQAWRREAPPKDVTPAEAVKGLFGITKLDPSIAASNLGVKSEGVNGEMLLAAAKKLIKVRAGEQRADPIDSLQYKELWTAGDQFAERLDPKVIASRVQSSLSKPKVRRAILAGELTSARSVIPPDLIERPLYGTFSTSLASNSNQTNPLSMLSDRSTATITGPGGITNPNQIKAPNTAIDPSHLGFLDPVFTPESNPGINTHLAAGVKIKDRKPLIRMYNLKTRKMEEVDAALAANSRIVLPDQVKWSGGHPSPREKAVRMSDENGEMRDDVPFSKAQYVLPSAAQVFAVETNMVPFMGNDAAGRTTMSARHLGQAISITGREPPAVQVEAGAGKTFEEVVGSTFLAHKAPIDGEVKAIRVNQEEAVKEIDIKGADGKVRTMSVYHHFPTNNTKGQLHSEVSVKVGDKVKKGQSIAEHNHSKDGKLALGTNLRTAYLANGYNHEDGIVISRSAAKKLSTEHLYKPSMLVGTGVTIDKKKFLTHKYGVYEEEQLSKIGDDGVIQVGTTVKPGDPLVLALRKDTKGLTLNDRTQARLRRKLQGDLSNSAMTWDSDYEGEVVRVVRNKKGVHVHVKTKEPMQVGDKMSTRHSAKGIVAEIREDDDMPVDGKGKSVQMLINPVSVPGRMNPGQILETAAGKISEKTGKPYVVKNFAGGVDYLKKVKDDLKKHGLSETETLFDPKTGRKLGDIMVGPHYTFQLEHQIDKKTHVRGSGMPGEIAKAVRAPHIFYDADTKIPRGGGKHGAQSLGSMGIYGALAAGLHDNLREMQTLKSDADQAMEAWGALNDGDVLPPPEVPYVFNKFRAMMMTLGVDMKKDGTKFRLMPRSDAETRALSRGALKEPDRGLTGDTDKEIKGGLYDPQMTGGRDGKFWSHIELTEPVPNPVYAKAIVHTLGLDARSPTNTILNELQAKKKGPRAFMERLKAVDLDKELARTKRVLDDPKTTGTALDKANYKYKALKAVKDSGKSLVEAWTMKAVPVLPPQFRQEGLLPTGTRKEHPLTKLYKRVGALNMSLQKGEGTVPYESTVDARAGVFKELANLFGTTPKGKKVLDADALPGQRAKKNLDARPLPGVIHMIAGEQPKDGFFQDKMIGKKQDYTARATIVADPTLSVEEIAVPRKIGLELYRPLVARAMQSLYDDDEKIHKMISEKHPVAIKTLERELKDRPVLMKRDPVLHQYGIIGQSVKLTKDNAIKVSPLVLPPLGGDVDGDQVALMVPLTREAVNEAKKVMPSQRTVSDSSGDVLYKPANESSLALYRMSIPRGVKTAKKFTTQRDAEKAFKENKIDLNDVIVVGGTRSTLGRMRIAKVLPSQYQKEILGDLKNPFTKKRQGAILKEIALKQPKNFVEVADGLSQLGFQMAYESGHTVSLKDLEPMRKERGRLLRQAEARIQKGVPSQQAWLDATKKLHDVYTAQHAKKPTNVSDMRAAGIKANREQFQGLVMAPMLVENHLGQPSKVPIRRSFSEGVDVGGYFAQASGARRGVIQKVDAVREPGYMTKLLVQANIDQRVTTKDCGTSNGVLLSVGDKDIVDRHLAQSLKIGGKTYPAGTVVTPAMLALAKGKVNKFLVRSPLKCRRSDGVCSRCMGVHPTGQEYQLGENVGVVSAQALGERAAQLMLKSTKSQGIVQTQGQDIQEFATVKRMFDASRRQPNDARLAPKAGKVKKITQEGGQYRIYLEGRAVPLISRQPPLPGIRAGVMVRKGQKLTKGDAHLEDMLKFVGYDATQSEMSKRVGDIYAREGVLRRHAELAVRTSTGVVHVTDPGDYNGFLRGDKIQRTVADELNRTQLKGKRPIRYKPALVATSMIPLQRQRDWMARLQGERIGQHIQTAVTFGQQTDVGRDADHPIPALAYGKLYGRKRF